MFEANHQNTQRGNLIRQFIQKMDENDDDQFDEDDIEKLQERLNAIRQRHQQQRLNLYDEYQNLRTKARDIAAESAQQNSSAASTATRNDFYTPQTIALHAQQSSSHIQRRNKTGSFSQTIDHIFSVDDRTPMKSARVSIIA